MPSFSQNYGHSPLKLPFQREALNPTTRLQLWNLLNEQLWSRWEHDENFPVPSAVEINNLLSDVWVRHLHWDLDRFYLGKRRNNEAIVKMIKEHFLEKMKWWEVYNFLEFLPRKSYELTVLEVLPIMANHILAENNTDCRFVGNDIAPITHPEQIDAIEKGITSGLPLVSQHLKQALAHFSDRQAPDYRNSIKESISAVECACNFATGETHGTLGQALKKIPDLHPALKNAFSSLYGFTSDGSGIRHALTDASTPVDKDDAQFMLVACSAFTSYLTVKAQKTP